MGTLTDTDLFQRIGGQTPLVHYPSSPAPPAPLGSGAQNDLVQPNSIDLRIGKIYLPEKAADDLGGANLPVLEHTLASGDTAVIKTLEGLSLPKNLCAIGFPPARLSISGLLMTNPGLVDPGYGLGIAGGLPLHCTVINMGRKPIPLFVGKPIISLVFVKLTQDCAKGFSDRVPKPEDIVDSHLLAKLSGQFANIPAEITKQISGQQWKQQVYAAALSSIATVFLAFVATQLLPWNSKIETLSAKVDVISARSEIERRLEALEGEAKSRIKVEEPSYNPHQEK